MKLEEKNFKFISPEETMQREFFLFNPYFQTVLQKLTQLL